MENSFYLNFLVALCLFFSITLIGLIYRVKKYWDWIEKRVESLCSDEFGLTIVFKVEQKIKRIGIIIFAFYFTYFCSIFSVFAFFEYTSIIIFVAYLLSYILIFFSSLITCLLLLNKKWKKEFQKKINDKKIYDFDVFFKNRVNYFFQHYSSKVTISEINTSNFSCSKNLFKVWNEEFRKEIAKINIKDNRRIYFLIMNYVEKYERILHNHQYKTKNGQFLDKKNILKNIFIEMKN